MKAAVLIGSISATVAVVLEQPHMNPGDAAIGKLIAAEQRKEAAEQEAEQKRLKQLGIDRKSQPVGNTNPYKNFETPAIPAGWLTNRNLRESVGHPVGDEAAEIKSALAILHENETEGDCRCKKWADVYRAKVNCGWGKEFPPLPEHMSHEPSAVQMATCQFMKAIPEEENFCVNTDLSHKARGQWCYVSGHCQTLNGGEFLKRHGGWMLSWKRCKKSEGDDLLSNYSPAKLMALRSRMSEIQAVKGEEEAQGKGMDISLLFRMAYGLWSQPFAYARSFWDGSDLSLDAEGHEVEIDLSPDFKDQLQDLFDHNKTALFKTHGAVLNVPVVIAVHGKHAYYVPEYGRRFPDSKKVGEIFCAVDECGNQSMIW